jgi:hypothetical protein
MTAIYSSLGIPQSIGVVVILSYRLFHSGYLLY